LGKERIGKLNEGVIHMAVAQTVKIPLRMVRKLEDLLTELAQAISPYRPDFLAKMYRARASDLEGKGRSLEEVRKRFLKHAR